MTEIPGRRSKDSKQGGYDQWVTSRTDWKAVIEETFEVACQFDFVLSVFSNSENGMDDSLVKLVNKEVNVKNSEKMQEYMSSFSERNFRLIEKHIKSNHNDLSLYRIKDQKIAAELHVPVNSNIFEIRSKNYSKSSIIIVFQKPRVPSEMELMLRRIQKKVLQKKKAWFF